MPDPKTKLATQLGQLATLGNRFPITCDACPSGTWLPSSQLAAPDSSGWPAVLDAYAATLGTPQRRIAASIALQSYGTRIAGLAIGAWVLFETTLSLQASEIQVRFEAGRTAELWLPTPVAVALEDRRETPLLTVGEELFDHLHPVVEAVRQHAPLNARRAWGNLAASCAGVFSALDRVTPPAQTPALRAKAEAFFAVTDWPIVGLIDWQIWGPPPSQGLCHERRTCCLMRDIPGKTPCESCSLSSPRERRAAWEASLRAPRPAPFVPTHPAHPSYSPEHS